MSILSVFVKEVDHILDGRGSEDYKISAEEGLSLPIYMRSFCGDVSEAHASIDMSAYRPK